MSDHEAFADEIAGFHAQQAAEKLLKAWLAIDGQVFPLTHNLGTLLDVLRDHEPDADRFRGLIALNPFAVQFRYEAITGDAEPLDREGLARSIQRLLERVQEALGETGRILSPENSKGARQSRSPSPQAFSGRPSWVAGGRPVFDLPPLLSSPRAFRDRLSKGPVPGASLPGLAGQRA